MSGYSRDTYSVAKNYDKVELQMEVPVVDADWNELQDNIRRKHQAFVYGIYGDGTPRDAFEVIESAVTTTNNFLISGDAVYPYYWVSGRGVYMVSNTEYVNQYYSEACSLTNVNGVTLTCSHKNWPGEGFLTDYVLEFTSGSLSGNTYTIATNSSAVIVLSTIGSGCAVGNKFKIRPKALTTPTLSRTDTVYLDVWEEEITNGEDTSLTDPTLGVAACNRKQLRGFVGVTENSTSIPSNTTSHFYCKVATLNRTASSSISTSMILDERDVGGNLPSGGGSGEWVEETGTVYFGSATLFTVSGDKTNTYVKGRMVKAAVLGGDATFTVAEDSTYGTLTSVYLATCTVATLTTPIANMYYSVVAPGHIYAKSLQAEALTEPILYTEDLLSQVDGTNMTFTTVKAAKNGSMALYHNGIRLRPGSTNDYNEVSHTSLALTTYYGAPNTYTTALAVTYEPIWGISQMVYNDDLTSQVDGSNVTFTTTQQWQNGSLQVYQNGLRQMDGALKDYTTIDNDTIVFTYSPSSVSTVVCDYDYNVDADNREFTTITVTNASITTASIGTLTSLGNITIEKDGVGIQRYQTDASGANVFRKCSACIGDSGESGASTVVDVVTLAVPASAQKDCVAGGIVHIFRVDGTAIGSYVWTAMWYYPSGFAGVHSAIITALDAVATPPTIAFSTDTLQITIPGYYVAMITCDLADKNHGLSGITWGANFS